MRNDNTLNIHILLASRKQVAVIWSIDDVRYVRPDLTKWQAWIVLQEIDRNLDASCGVNWDTLEYVADELFPEPKPSPAKRRRQSC